MNKPQMVRITSLAKTLTTFDNSIESLLKSGICHPDEIDVFKRGFQCALDLVRKEYGINVEKER